MRRELKTLLILLTVCIITTLSLNLSTNVQSETIVDEDWSTYQPISDQNLNSSRYKILADSSNNIHVFWSAKNTIENYSQIVYEIRFNNGSSKISNIIYEQNQSSYIEFDVDIDFSDKIHLIYYNQTAETFVYQIVNNTNLEQIDEFEVDFQNFYMVVDGLDRVHFIYLGYDRNLHDMTYFNNLWLDTVQITNYSVAEDEYITIFRVRKTKSLQGKVALIYTFKSINYEESTDRTEIHCVIFDGLWLNYKIIADYYNSVYDICYDDTEKLHLIWDKLDNANEINYQTTIGTKWSEIEQYDLFDNSQTDFGTYLSLFAVSLEIQGATRLIAFTAYQLLELCSDIDLFLTMSNDGQSWTSTPIYRGNLSRTYNPLIESTSEGNVYVIAYEDFIGIEHNSTIFFGHQEALFTYQTTEVSLENIVPLFFVTILIPVYRKKTRQK